MKTVCLFVDDEFICDVLQYALDNFLTLPDAQKQLEGYFTGQKIEYIIK